MASRMRGDRAARSEARWDRLVAGARVAAHSAARNDPLLGGSSGRCPGLRGSVVASQVSLGTRRRLRCQTLRLRAPRVISATTSSAGDRVLHIRRAPGLTPAPAGPPLRRERLELLAQAFQLPLEL